MKSNLLGQFNRSSRTETAVFASLWIVAMITVGAAIVSMSNFVQEKDKLVAAVDGHPQAASKNSGYIASGRWLADAKTLASMARWLLEPDAAITNVVTAPSNSSRPNAVVSTNSTGVSPKA
jgi:hypothetical protein